MIVLGILAFVSVFLFLGAVASVFGRMAEGGGGFKERRDHITVLKVEGPIMDSEAYMESIQRISENDACKGVLVRIDSPGGAVGASQEIYTALKALKDRGMPIVVSQGNVAASGGYYISLAGDRIFANKGTLTGSIGVILQFPEAEKLMEKAGVKLNTLKSGALKDAGNFSRPPRPEEIRYLQSVIDDTFGQFIEDVLASPGMDKAELLKVADGRVMTGKQALESRLVDTLGGFHEARQYLVGVAKLSGEPVIVKEPPMRGWLHNMLESQASAPMGAIADLAREWLPSVRQGTFYIWK